MKTFLTASVTTMAMAMAISSASAYGKDAPGTGPNPYADCGIGGAIFSELKWAAATSNVIWDLGTTALSSATLSPGTCNGKKATAARLLNDSFEQVSEDLARGNGKHLNAALIAFECLPGNVDVIADARKQFATVARESSFGTADRQTKVLRLYQIMDLSTKTCTA
jgi:Protein of unknown function (DUF3015)